MNCTFRIVPGAGAEADPRVQLLVPDEPTLEEVFEFDVSERVDLILQAIEGSTCPLNDVREIGTRLLIALSPGAIGDRIEALGMGATPGNPLLVRLDIPAELERHPWESLHHSQWGFLSSDPRFCVVRAVDRASRNLPPTPIVRVLVVSPAGSGLLTHYEWNNFKRLEGTLGGLLSLKTLDGATADELGAALKPNSYDVLHYMGHGRQSAEGGVELLLNDGTGAKAWHAAAEFAKNLVGKGLRLCVINCCFSAEQAASKIIGSIVKNVAQMADVPAVIGMKYEVADEVAIRFAGSLYPHLLTGERAGFIASAVQAARLSLTNAYPKANECRAFITPVLTLVPGHERLFELQAPAPVAAVPAAAPALDLPVELLEGIAAGRYIPAIGLGLLRASQDVRRPALPTAVCVTDVIRALAISSNFPETADLAQLDRGSDAYVAWVFSRVCQFFQHSGQFQQRGRLVGALRRSYAAAQPAAALTAISNWTVPAILYTGIDDLMAAALRAPPRPRQFRCIKSLVQGAVAAAQYDIGPASHELLLVNVCGTLATADGLALTEKDFEQLWDSLARDPPTQDVRLLQNVVRQPEHGLLFLGFSPRDTTARRLARLLDSSPNGTQGPSYFVSQAHTAADVAYWRNYGVQFISARTEEVVERLSELFA